MGEALLQKIDAETKPTESVGWTNVKDTARRKFGNLGFVSAADAPVHRGQKGHVAKQGRSIVPTLFHQTPRKLSRFNLTHDCIPGVYLHPDAPPLSVMIQFQ